MHDRVPTYPGRIKLVPVSGKDGVYDVKRADEPVQEGTPLNKKTLFSDTSSLLYGFGPDAVPDNAFQLLGLTANTKVYGFVVHVQSKNGVPISGAKISGVTPISSSSSITDEDGNMIGYATSSKPNITVSSSYIDLTYGSTVIEDLGGIIKKATIIMEENTSVIEVLSSKSYKCSKAAKTVDLCIIAGGGGGGGGGGANYNSYAGGGGGGGQVINKLGVQIGEDKTISITVGSGGSGGSGSNSGTVAGSSGGYGGFSYVTINGVKYEATPGAPGGGGGTAPNTYYGLGGVGWGNGGDGGENNGTSGKPNSTYIFNDSSLGLAGGGGGGGGCDSGVGSPASGGEPYGGSGATSAMGPTSSDGPGGGGGGGAGIASNTSYKNGGSGHAGKVYIRFHF